MTMIKLKFLFLFISVSPTLVVFPAQDSTRPTASPSKSVDEMFQRFTDECIAITPGTKKFPAIFFVGATVPAKNEIPRRKETLNSKFRISQFEMTQELYSAITGDNPSRWPGSRNSVERVTFSDAVEFCQQLTAELHKRKLIEATEFVRLPTSVEWEYCCRAGTDTRYSFGDSAGKNGSTQYLNEYAWHTGNAAGNDPAVGVLKGNAWKLHDMHGYLWEFVDDSTEDAPNSSRKKRVKIRGGSWRDKYSLLSCATHLAVPDSESGDHIGFRCVIAQKPGLKNGAKR